MDLLYTCVKILVGIGDNYDVRGFIVLENILLFFVRASTSDTDTTFRPFLNNLLGFPFRTYDSTNIVSFGIVHSCLREIYFFVFLQRFIVLRRHEILPHLHTVLNKPDSFPMKCVSFTHLACIDSSSVFVVDRLRAGRSDISILGGEVIYFGSQLVESVKSYIVKINKYSADTRFSPRLG